MSRSSVLLVANYHSGVGYAWWLMESFWAAIARRYSSERNVVLCYPQISSLPDAILSAPLRTLEVDFSSTSLRAVIKQLRFVRDLKVDLIYLSDAAPIHWRYALFRLGGARHIVVHDHSPGVRETPVGWKRVLKRTLHSLGWISADGYFGASDYVKKRLIESTCAPPTKCFSVPNGLPPSSMVSPTDLFEQFSIPPSRTIIVMTGRASRYKGIHFALRCMAELVKGRGLATHFLFCGDGPDLEEFRRECAVLGVTSHVTFAGRRTDLAAILQSCHIGFHPSQGEVGYSLSILEYMKAGLPVVVPNNPSISGATRDGVDGLLYRENDVASACAALSRLVNDSELRREMGSKGMYAVESKYQLSDTHGALLSALDQVLKHT